MSNYCAKCGKEIKESSPDNGLFCQDCSVDGKKDIILLTDDPRVISVYRKAAGKTVSGKDEVFSGERKSQPAKLRNKDQGDENDHPVSPSADDQASDTQTAEQKTNNSKLTVIIGVSVIAIVAAVFIISRLHIISSETNTTTAASVGIMTTYATANSTDTAMLTSSEVAARIREFSVMIDGEDYKLPMKVSELLERGWTLQKPIDASDENDYTQNDYDYKRIEPSLSYRNFITENSPFITEKTDGSAMFVGIVNSYSRSEHIENCFISSLSLGHIIGDVRFPGNLVYYESSSADIKAYFGFSTDFEVYDDEIVICYAFNRDGYIFNDSDEFIDPAGNLFDVPEKEYGYEEIAGRIYFNFMDSDDDRYNGNEIWCGFQIDSYYFGGKRSPNK